MKKLVLFLLALVMLAPAARADDIAAASRSVVRVVVIAYGPNGEVQAMGHGSGFAVARNRIVTNAHVVQPAVQHEQQGGRAEIGVVPSEGSQAFGARIIRVDTSRDLALIEFERGSLPVISLFTGALEDGASVAALGYPGNVDLATGSSPEDYIRPLPPTRAAGNFSNMRPINGISALLHTANIARGNSGGPLVDACGRVLGVNTFITRGDNGDAPFAFAVAMRELTAFLRTSQQDFNGVTTPCVSMEQRLEQDRERAATEARERERQEQARERAEQQRLVQAMAENQAARENRTAIALTLMVFGLIALGAAAVLFVKNKHRPAYIAAGAGAFLLIVALVVFFTRPTLSDIEGLNKQGDEPADAAAAAMVGQNVCRLVPDRSRVVGVADEQVDIEWQDSGCLNDRTQYAEDGEAWTRILVPNEEQTVSVLEVRPAAGEYIVNRYLLGADAMSQARRLRRRIDLRSCTSDQRQRADLAERQQEIRRILPELPNERLVYECTSGTGGGERRQDAERRPSRNEARSEPPARADEPEEPRRDPEEEPAERPRRERDEEPAEEPANDSQGSGKPTE